MAQNYCSTCIHFKNNVSPKWEDEYYCDVTKHYQKSMKACDDYSPKPNSGYQRAGFPWYITSIICQRLSLGPECEMLKTTFTLKENYFAQFNQEFLSEYDIVGPQISFHLMTAPIEEIQDLYQRFLIPCHEDIKFGLLKPAADIYQNMVEELKVKYLQAGETQSIDTQRLRVIPELA